jgi:hypothetical protein
MTCRNSEAAITWQLSTGFKINSYYLILSEGGDRHLSSLPEIGVSPEASFFAYQKDVA